MKTSIEMTIRCVLLGATLSLASCGDDDTVKPPNETVAIVYSVRIEI